MTTRLLISHRGVVRRFLSFDFRDHADGSFYVVFDGGMPQGKVAHLGYGTDPAQQLVTAETERFRISYHASGIVRYHGVKAATIFCEPIHHISKDFGVARISIADMGQMPPVDQVRSTDVIAPLDDSFSGRITFRIGIRPHGEEPIPIGFTRVDYLHWFALAISLVSFDIALPSDLRNVVTMITPRRGCYATPVMTKDEALIAFHRKKSGSAPHMCSWEPTQGVGRIVFSQVMRRVPTLTVHFFDPLLRAEVLHASQAEVRFRVRGPNGYLRNEAPRIVGFELGAGI